MNLKNQSTKKRILVFSSVHRSDDTRILHKQVASICSKDYDLVYCGSDEFVNKKLEQKFTYVNLKTIQLHRFIRFLKGNFLIIFYFLKFKPTLIHYHDPELHPAILLIRMMGFKSLIFDMHEFLPGCIQTKNYLNKYCKKILTLLVKRIETALFPHIFIIFAERWYSKQYNLSSNKFRVIQNFPLISNNKIKVFDREKSGAIRLLYVGSLSGDRGLSSLLHLGEKINQCGYKIKIFILGQESKSDNRFTLNKKYKSKTIKFLGQVEHRRLPNILQKVDYGLSLIKPTKNYKYSLPTKIMEYAMNELPIVACYNSYGSRIVSKFKLGIYQREFNSEKLLNEIITDYDNQEKYKKYRKNCLKFSEKFTWANEMIKLNKFYRSII
jgi:glycosyltransferase involved in cell wall biosynthesis